MNINALGSTASQHIQTAVTAALSGASTAGDPSGANKSADDDAVSLSGPARSLGRLQELATSDPARFKDVVTQISDRLSTAADSASTPGLRAALGDAAARFGEAATTGDVSSLRPPAGGRPAGPPPGGRPSGPPPGGDTKGDSGKTGGGLVAASTADAQPDPADANEDGTVTEAERESYAAKKAAAKGEATKRGGHGYDAREGDPVASAARSQVDAVVADALDAAAG